MYEIKWSNVVMFGLGIVLLITLIRARTEVGAVVGTIRHVGTSPSLTDRTFGLMVFGLIIVFLVALFRFMIDSQNRD